jgi:maltooligosyltrehalose trehalohydrolase
MTRTVDVEIADTRIAMSPSENGWWGVDVPDAGSGTEYRFVVDGGARLPGPRSSWQPHGVHGPSRVVDHAAFPWSDQRSQPPPLAAGVIYELHVGTFTPEGTFASAIERLAHLIDLGVTHVELMPVAEFSGARGWGYDGVDLFAPHHAYGGPDGLKRLVNACHERGLAVLLDVVYNHLGPVGNYLGRFGPYFTDRYATPWGEAVNFDGRGSDEVRRFVFDNARAWLEDYHIDGLRVDAVHAIFDRSALHVLEELAGEVRTLEAHLGRRLVLIAESDLNDPGITRSPGLGGYGLDAQQTGPEPVVSMLRRPVSSSRILLRSFQRCTKPIRLTRIAPTAPEIRITAAKGARSIFQIRNRIVTCSAFCKAKSAIATATTAIRR